MAAANSSNACLTYTSETAPTNSPQEIPGFFAASSGWAACWQMGPQLVPQTARYASDPRWRAREGVAMALQRLGKNDMGLLLREMDAWGSGSWLENAPQPQRWPNQPCCATKKMRLKRFAFWMVLPARCKTALDAKPKNSKPCKKD